jgi:hypothetical protein
MAVQKKGKQILKWNLENCVDLKKEKYWFNNSSCTGKNIFNLKIKCIYLI